MKKNEHYFPTMEVIKDPSEDCGWRRVTYEGGKQVEGEGKEGGLPVAEDADPDVDMEVAASGADL